MFINLPAVISSVFLNANYCVYKCLSDLLSFNVVSPQPSGQSNNDAAKVNTDTGPAVQQPQSPQKKSKFEDCCVFLLLKLKSGNIHYAIIRYS